MKIHSDIEQGSVDWCILRSGKVTASEMDALISPLGKVRTGDGVSTYLNQKLCEIWTGGPLIALQGVFDVDQGKLLEERARPAFTIHTGIEVQQVSFIETDDGRAGCSPDALIDSKSALGNPFYISGVEIKCPRMDTHVGYLLAGGLPKQYVAQVQSSMFVTGFATWHFFSYHRQLPPLHLVIERDEEYQEALQEALDAFLERLDAAMARLIEMNGGERPKRHTLTPRPEPAEERVDVGH